MVLSKVQMCSQTQYEDKNACVHLWNWKKMRRKCLVVGFFLVFWFFFPLQPPLY